MPIAQVFLLKPAPFCMLFAGLGSINKSVTSLFFSYYLTLALSSPPSFLLPQSLWQIWQELSSLSSCCIRLQWVPRHSFLPGNDAADELVRRGALLAPSAIPCTVVSLLLSLVSTLVFSRTGGVLSHRNSCCCCCLPDPFRGIGAWWKTMEPQKPGNSPGSGPEVIKRQRVAKE